VIEFLIAEKPARPRDGREKVPDVSRDDFRRRQLHAAIRRDVATARQAVRDFDR
jgi:hypothetical protein